MDERDLVELIAEGRMISETIEIFKEVIDRIEDNPFKFTDNLKSVLQQLCSEYNCCPECGSELELVESYEESRGEYLGVECYETVNTYGCVNCNYIEV